MIGIEDRRLFVHILYEYVMSIGNGALMIALMKKLTTLGADVVLDVRRCGVMYQFDGKGDVK